MGLARNADALRRRVGAELANYGWSAASFDDVELLSAVKAREPLSHAFEEMERLLLKTGQLQFGRFFLYPLAELASAQWLAEESEDPRLSATQSALLENLAQMLGQLAPDLIAEDIGLTGQGTQTVDIFLPHREESELDLTIRVRGDVEITVDYGYGHLHFCGERGGEWALQALDFIYGALQGGVRVEIWARDGTVGWSRALLLLENGDWSPMTAWSALPEPLPETQPSVVKLLGFTGPAGTADAQETPNTR